jgi:uncharacterized protein YcbK (DUF882 family)
VPISHARTTALIPGVSRVGRSAVLAAIVLLLGNTALQNAVANGDTRSLTFHHTHRDDNLTITYRKNGQFDEEALKKLNYFLRDWRTDEQTNMDRRLFDILWEVYGEVGGKEPINIVSSYRSPATNAMLRRRSRGVAKFSQHMLGHAIDFYIPNVALEDIRNAGLRLQRGGVGFYPTSGSPFVHLDVGGVRHWPRMTHDQLAKVFPDGRTVHIPTDGQPLKGYALALADMEKRGSSPSQNSLDAARNSGIQVASAGQPKRSFLASLFRGKDEDEDAEAAPAAAPAATTVASAERSRTPAAAAKAVPTTVAAAPAPKPSLRPTVLASASPTTTIERQTGATRGAAPAQQQPAAVNSINDIINSRGFWQGVMTAPPETAPAAPAPAAKVVTASNSKFPRWPYADKDKDADDTTSSVLAYSKSNEPDPAPKAQAMGSSMGSAAPGRATTASLGPSGLSTIVQKSLAPLRAQQPAAAPTMLPASGKWAAMPGQRSDDPWLRAVILSPSVQHYLTATFFGEQDYRSLRPHLQKPSYLVVASFTDDPTPGLVAEAFSGTAIAFQPVVLFGNRTAALR